MEELHQGWVRQAVMVMPSNVNICKCAINFVKRSVNVRGMLPKYCRYSLMFTGVFARATRGLAFGDWGNATLFFVDFFSHSFSFFCLKTSLCKFVLPWHCWTRWSQFRRSSDSSCRRTERQRKGRCRCLRCETISNVGNDKLPMLSCFHVSMFPCFHSCSKICGVLYILDTAARPYVNYSFPAVPCIVQELKQQKREAEKLNVGSLCAFAAYVLNVFAEKWVNRKELGKFFRESEMNRSRVSEKLSSKPKTAEWDSPESGSKLRGTSWRLSCFQKLLRLVTKTKDTKSRQIAMNMVSLCLIQCERTRWWGLNMFQEKSGHANVIDWGDVSGIQIHRRRM